MSLAIEDSSVDGNFSGNAGGIFAGTETLTIRNSSISGNTGGGLVIGGSSTAIVDGSTISNNTNHGDYGGGVSVFGHATFTNCVMENNESRSGGAIFFQGGDELIISDCTISGNSTTGAGGAIMSYFEFADGPTIERTTISNNSSGSRGGAISLFTSHATIIDSTISDNSADSHGGAINLDDNSGIRVVNSTVSNNSAPQGSAIFGNSNGQVTRVNIAHSTIFNNQITDSSAPVDITHSILTDPIAGSLGVDSFNLVSATPGLAPLADNGGPTMTHALLSDSLALNTGAFNAVAGTTDVPLNDQRGAGFQRVAGGRIDIGSFERPADSWHNFGVAADVNGDRITSPVDALLVINELNNRQFSSPETGQLPDVAGPPPFLDVVEDGIVSPLDALAVINVLNAASEASNRNAAANTDATTDDETTGPVVQQSINSIDADRNRKHGKILNLFLFDDF